jgi:hypothetical protein
MHCLDRNAWWQVAATSLQWQQGRAGWQGKWKARQVHIERGKINQETGVCTGHCSCGALRGVVGRRRSRGRCAEWRALSRMCVVSGGAEEVQLNLLYKHWWDAAPQPGHGLAAGVMFSAASWPAPRLVLLPV